MKVKLIKIQTDKLQYMIWEKDRFVRLDERRLAKFIPNYLDMTQRGREKHLKKWLKNEVSDIRCVECGPQLPNAMAKIKTDGRKRTCSDEDLRLGAQIFLDAMELFEPIETGYHLVADILCGQHAMALRAAEPSFHGISAINFTSPEVEALLRDMVLIVVPLRKWSGKNWEVHREAVLDYRTKQFFPKHVQDHTRLKAKCKKSKLELPAPYADTVALVIGAVSSQINELVPYIENAAVIFFNCSRVEPVPTRLTISGYDPEVAQRFRMEASRIAALLRWWWCRFRDEDAWAVRIVQEARASFGVADRRYVQVVLDPKLLRGAIRYRVLLSFLDELEQAELMTSEQLESYRQGAKVVFAPEPKPAAKQRHAEDLDVFLELMRKLAEERTDAIVPEGQRFVKSDKHLAAWRTISGERHLVFLENTWAMEYKRAAKRQKELDCSFFQRDKWTLELQKILVQEGLIKAASSGFRYRYDLLEIGKKDQTYVVAMPVRLLEDPANF